MNPSLPSLYTCIYKFYTNFINLDIGCRLRAGSPNAAGRRMPSMGRFAGCCRSSDVEPPIHRRTSDAGRRFPPVPITIECQAADCHRSGPSGAADPVPDALCHRSGFGLSKPLHVVRQPPLLVQVTLNSLCSTHRHKDSNFCSTLYIVGALFDLSMWDTS